MKEEARKYGWGKRLLAFALAMLMMVGYLPTAADAASEPGTVDTVADPGTLPRVEQIYGENTMNAGKVSVGKSVSDGTVTLPTGEEFTPAKNNFIVTVSQAAQVMGLASESAVPVDVVFVLDTSGSMGYNNQERKTGRAEAMLNAANSAIATLLAANEHNRVSVVAFSSQNYGEGTSNNSAANVLSSLYHYEGDAATKHLQWVNNNGSAYTGSTTDTTSTQFGVGSSYNLIAGRATDGKVDGTRNGGNGGTNIHAGIALGAQQLTAVSDTTVTYADGTTVTRMPFVVLLSDGAPTFSSSIQNWYNPSQTSEQGPGSKSYAGNGFLAALTAAYYKGVITEHYYGNKANSDDRCSVYTIGVQLESQSNEDDVDLARLTMNPKTYLPHGTNSFADDFTSYWNSYNTGNSNFNILVNYQQEWKNIGTNWNPNWQWVDTDPVYYTVNKDTFAATRNYVNGKNSSGTAMYAGGIAYNDGYYNANQTSEIAGIFTSIVDEIQKKAISSPTHVGTHGADFSGYVTFTDPLGAYMEVKDMKGIVANGAFLQGSAAAKYLSAYGKAGNANNNPNFDAALKAVLQKRLSMTSSQATDAFINDFAQKVLASENQAWWESNTNFDNSIVWWGNSYPTNEEDEMVQILGFADDDSIEYIEKQIAAGNNPADADYVCRSYFYYGTTQGSEQDYLYFVIRVQRELTAPYKQTVVVSVPASLLSADQVLITEENGGYTARVTHEAPVRVVYEVGLLSDINPQNVAEKVSADYKGASVDSGYSVNYDAATDTYYFFTNDWNRTVTGEEHHRALAKATFDAAADNAFYTYQQNTTITDEDGNAYKGTAKPSGTWYYVREYYDWSQASYNSSTGVYTGVEKKNAVIRIELAADAGIQQASDGTWYIPKGVYAASTLVVNGDDVRKAENKTGTAEIVAHPHRTGTSSNSHYTVLLGNNGRLAVVSDPAKSVSIGNSSDPANGKPVMVGDTLTYTIKVVNNEGVTANAVVTDTVPAGTKFISADNSGALQADGKTVRWELTGIPAGENKTVSFKVQVLPSALSGSGNVATIDNVATIQVGNNPAYTTNKVSNPPEGKKVTDTSGNELADGTTVKVGDVLVYRVRAYNDTGAKADVTITDAIPAGTTYVPGSADHDGVLSADGKTLTWNIQGLEPNTSVVVSFRVEVDASAKQNIENKAKIEIGDRNPDTNMVTTPVGTGSISITKNVASGSTAEEFTLILNESQGKLNGTYTMTGANQNEVTFVNGVSTSTVTIKNGQTLTIQGLPLGAGINVAEAVNAGWTPSYNVGTEVVTAAFVTVSSNTPVVTVTNNYYAQPAHFQLKGTKNFVGSGFPAGNFTFEAVEVILNSTTGQYEAKSGATPMTATVIKGEDNASLDIVFGDVTIIQPFDERYFKITEKVLDSQKIPGVVYDDTEYIVKLSVTDNSEGQLEASAVLKSGNQWVPFEQNELSFTNYYPEETMATISGTKTLENRYIQDNEFSFELVENGKVIDTVLLKADGDGTAPFSFIRNYTAADMVENGVTKTKRTFNYTVREVIGSDSSIQYSTQTVKEFPVTVVVEMVQGQLVATVDYGISDIEFTNIFTPVGVELVLEGTKILKDGSTGTQVTSDIPAFSFGIYSGDTQIASATNGSDGKFTFSPIGYTLADMVDGSNILSEKTFTYTVKENVPAEGAPTRDHSMRYSGEEYTITVKVTYVRSTGTMSAQVTSVTKKDSTTVTPVPERYEFTNTKYPETVTVTPVASKTVTGTNAPKGLRFSFSVVNAETGIEAATGISTATNAASNEGLSVEFTHMVYDYSNWLANRDSETSDTATLYYWIQESNTANGWVDASNPGNGIKYDSTRYLMKVVLTYNNGQLIPAVTYYKANNATDTYLTVAGGAEVASNAVAFANEYHAAGYINLQAVKNIAGGTGWTADQFDFHLQRWDETTSKVVSGSEIVGINGEFTNGVAPITFATLNYSAENLNQRDIKYVMTEVDPGMAAIPGVTYDKAAYIVTIHLEADGGSIIASVKSVQKATFTGEGEDRVYVAGETIANATKTNDQTNTWTIGKAVFTNKYTPTSVDVEIKATKTLTGRDLKPGEFGFELYRIQKNKTTGQIEEFLAATATNQALTEGGTPDSIIFKRTYNAANLSSAENGYTVTYVIKETPGSLGGVTYTDKVYYAQVDIGHSQTDAKYVVKDVRYYKDNPLEINNAAEIEENAVIFNNSYTTNNAHYTPVAFKAFKQRGKDGAWTDKAITAGQFTFSVIELDANNGYAAKNSGAAVAAGVSLASDSLSAVDFGRLTYSHNAIGGNHAHYYKIVEDEGNEPGVTYDSKAYYLKVTINDNGNGVLSVTKAEYYSDLFTTLIATHTDSNGDGTWSIDEIQYPPEKQILFTNHYGPGSITIQPGDLKKIVQVKDNAAVIYHLEGSEFNFDLYAYNGTADEWKDAAWQPTDDPLTSGTNGASVNGVAPINFGSITYTSEQVRNNNTPDANGKYTATYNYIVVERDLDAASIARGLTKDGKKIKLTITVTDDGFGNLSAKVSKVNDKDIGAVTEADRTFTNVYDAPELKVQFTADKTLVNKKLTANEFKFLLEWNENGTDKGEYLYNDADGKIISPEFVFTSAGEYLFTMREVDKGSPNYKCDDSVYTIKVNVIDDLDGKLHATLSYTKTVKDENGNDVTTNVAGIDFVNTYIPSEIEVDLSTAIGATKTVLDPDGNEMQGKAEGFDFELVDVTGAVVATGTSDATGRILFNKITFKTAGEYHFRIREAENADKPGYTMDEQAWRVYVLVRYYDGTGTAPVINGTPVAPGSLYIDAADVQTFPVSELEAHSEPAPEFVNIYNPEPLHLTLKATKKLVGRDLLDGEFTFHLVEGNLLRGEAKNQADGTIAFALTYKLPGTYTYELHEHVPAALDKLEGVTYDEKVHTVTVEVKDQNGKLVVDGTTSTWDTGVTFENTYKPGPTTATIIAHKVLEGKPLAAGEFSFELLDSQDKVIDKVTNDASGNVVFTVEVPAADEYHYSIREVKGTDTDHYTYDQNTYKVTVKASQNAAGKLVTEVSYDTADGKMPVFKNTYKPDGTTITLEGTKKLTGRDMAAGEFKFEVRDGVGNLVSAGTNDANGKIVFEAVKLPVAGTYKLTVTEVKGSAEGMSYDSSAITVTVKVVNENGVLVATAEYPEAGIVFTNAYEKVEETTVPETTAPEETTVPETTEPEKPKDPTVPDTGDHANLGLWIAVLAGSVLLFAVTFVVVIIPRKKGTYEK